MDRICISAASESIKSDLAISNQMMGYIFGIFALGYALFQIPSGWIADKYGPKKNAFVGSSGMELFYSSYGSRVECCFHAGAQVFYSVQVKQALFPGATKAFYHWVPPKERGLANGIFHSGARVGAAASLLLLPLLINLVGWRLTFVINGILGLCWVLIWVTWYKDDPRQNKKVNKLELEYIESGIIDNPVFKGKLPLGQILTSSNMIMVMFQYIASNITFFISFTWLLPYLVSQWGAGAEIFAPVPLLFGMFAQWISGWLMTVIYEKGFHVSSRKIPAITGFLIAVIGLILITIIQGSSPLTFTLLFSVAVLGVEMTISPSWSLCMDIGGEHSGTVSATMNMLGNMGSAVSAIIFPFFVGHVTIPFLVKTTGTANSFFLFAAVMNLLAAGAWLYIRPNRKIGDLNPKQVRKRLIMFMLIVFLLVIGVILYKFLNT